MNATPVHEPGAGGVAAGLLSDGSLTLEYDPVLRSLVEPWIPRLPRRRPAGARSRSHIRVRAGRVGPSPPAVGEPAIRLRDVRTWIDPKADRAVLAHEAGILSGTVDLKRLDASLVLDPRSQSGAASAGAFAALTITAALVLTRTERLLVHAGAFVSPGGGAWLLIGDSFSGKSSTCANLIRAGWDYLADDQVIVHPAAGHGGMVVEGWPRAFNLDDGFGTGASLGTRTRADPAALGPGRWRESAPLAGLLFTGVEAEDPTRLHPAVPGAALGALIRQSPWLLADPSTAPAVLRTMTGMVKSPSYDLRLGYDSYRDPRRLETVLLGVVDRAA